MTKQAASASNPLVPRSLIVFAALTLAAVTAWQTRVAVQTPGPPVKAGEAVKLDPAEARRIAQQTRQSIPLQLADGLEVSIWATKQLVADTLPLDLDANGAAYVGSTPRGSQWLDTRQHPDWVPEIQRLTTTAEP